MAPRPPPPWSAMRCRPWQELVRRGVKAVVVACNTASSAALPALTAAHPQLPVVGVIEPGAAAAVAATTQRAHRRARHRGHGARRRLPARDPEAPAGRRRSSAVPATLFVALAEEGWVQGEVAEAVARRYLAPLFVIRRAATRHAGAGLHAFSAAGRCHPRAWSGPRCRWWIPRSPRPACWRACSRHGARSSAAARGFRAVSW